MADMKVEGNLLYHLAFIAEHGEGTINFMVKTDFGAPELTLVDPVEKVKPDNEANITAHIEEQANLETVTLNYTSNNWTTSTAAEMLASQNRTYTGTIPGQPAGTVVNYTVLARDTSGNSAEVLGSYAVKNWANITLDLSSPVVYYGENITVTGQVHPIVENLTVTVTFTASNSTIEQTAYTDSNGTYLVSWKPDSMELWQVHAHIAEDDSRSAAYSNSTTFKVTDTWLNQYMLYIIGGVGGVAGVSVVVFIIRRRRYE